MRKRRYTCLEGPSPNLDGGPLPVVHNIVSTAQIKSSVRQLDLDRIRQLLPFSFYDRSKFAAITIRLSNPDCTTLLFSSGKLVVTGGRTWYESVYSSLFVARLLQECMPSETFALTQCAVQNMVAHVELPVGPDGMLDLQAMYARLGLNCTYQKRMFPGLIYRPEASPVVLLCFYSGKIVITGGKTLGDIYEGWTRLWPIVRGFVTNKHAAPEAVPHAVSHPGAKRRRLRAGCHQCVILPSACSTGRTVKDDASTPRL